MGEENRKIDWMYAGASAHVDREEYLLGRSIDSNLQHVQQDDDKKCHTRDETLVNIPGALFEEKQQAVELDQRAKIREDPLVAIARQAEERRKELLANPYRLKQLKQKYSSASPSTSFMPRREHGENDEKSRNHEKRKHSDLDGTERLLKALKSVGVNKLNSLLQDDGIAGSSTDDSSGARHRYDRNERSQDYLGNRTDRRNTDRRWTPDGARRVPDKRNDDARSAKPPSVVKTSSAQATRSSGDDRRIHSREEKPRLIGREDSSRLNSRQPFYKPPRANARCTDHEDDDEATMQKKLDEMRKNAEWRAELNDTRLKDAEKRNQTQLARDKVEAKQGKGFIHTTLAAAVSASSVEQRIRSNLNNVQRTTHALNQNFAKR